MRFEGSNSVHSAQQWPGPDKGPACVLSLECTKHPPSFHNRFLGAQYAPRHPYIGGPSIGQVDHPGLGTWLWSPGSRVQGLRCRFGAQCLGLGSHVWGPGSGNRNPRSGFRDPGSGIRSRAWDLRLQVWGAGCEVWGMDTGVQNPGTGPWGPPGYGDPGSGA